MNQRMQFALAAGLALGVLAFLVTLSRGLDLAAHNATIESLRQLKQLDSNLNEETLRARLLIDPDSTALLDIQPKVRDAVKALNQGDYAIGRLDDASLMKAYTQYGTVVEEKLKDVNTFDTDNLSLSDSIDTMRHAGEALLAALPSAKYLTVRLQIQQLLKEILEYGLLPAPDNAQKLQDLRLEFAQVATTLPIELQQQAVQLSSGTNTVLNQRQLTDRLLAAILAAPTSQALSAVQSAYDINQGRRLQDADFYRHVLIGYSVLLLVALGYLGFRLSRSYLEINKANEQLARANETLEHKVDERTQDLTKAYAALQSTQAQVVQSEKMASLGQMVAGMAHEVNTPLGFARSNIEMVGGMFKDITALLAQYARAVGMLREPQTDPAEMEQVLDVLAQKEAELNPTVLAEEADLLLQDGKSGLDRIHELVVSLRDFSRLDRSRDDLFDVNHGLDTTLNICNSNLESRIEVIKNYGQLPMVRCAPSQINQVFMNMINNAAQAIDGRGTLRLSTRADADNVSIVIEDSGCGMPAEVVSKIFEPFFTTKDVGKGTGLGLSIVYQIVQEHGGRIDVDSTPGEGTRFTVMLPHRQKSVRAEVSSAA